MAVIRTIDACSIEGAHAAAMPAKLQPQLPILVATVPSGDQWLHEIKYDGYRIVARLARGEPRLISRNGNDWTAKFPTIAAALGDLPVKDALLDGEVVHEQPNGVTSFSLLAIDLSEGRTEHLVYYVFDLCISMAVAYSRRRSTDRKRILEALLAPRPAGLIRCSRHVKGNGSAFYAKCCAGGLEGVVSKRRRWPLRSRTRARVAQDQMRRPRGVRDHRLDRPRRQPRGFWLTACWAITMSQGTSTLQVASAPALPAWYCAI